MKEDSFQEIVKLKISDLHLWTENPRDPIDRYASDEDIIKRAIANNDNAWNLDKLSSNFGEYYDKSELPIVVEENGSYVVYDGNRRIAMLKYIQNKELRCSVGDGQLMFGAAYPQSLIDMKEIECDLCDKETALKSVQRKHIDNGSWKQIQRDYFEFRHMKKSKSDFIILNESLDGLIEKCPELNQRFVKEEILSRSNLNQLGFDMQNDKLVSNYDVGKAQEIIQNIIGLVCDKEVTTRKNRGKTVELVRSKGYDIHSFNGDCPINEIKGMPIKHRRKTQVQKGGYIEPFGGTLTLRKGQANDIYRDFESLYKYYVGNKDKLSKSFPAVFRVMLRLMVESVSGNSTSDYSGFVDKYFDRAKNNLKNKGNDLVTTLANFQVSKGEDLKKLLNNGGHNYEASAAMEQTLAMSLIVGEMVVIAQSKLG